MRTTVKVFAFGVIVLCSAAARAQVDQIKTWHPCAGTDPTAYEVYIYQNGNFGGSCAALYQGFYPSAGNVVGGFGLANDSISSLKVGSAVRARLFSDGIYGGSYFWFGGWGQYNSMPTGWNDVASSIRVENNSRSTTCNDLQSGEFAVFRDANFVSDCVVLRYSGQYRTPSSMGIANDSISSANPGPRYVVAAGCDSGADALWWVGFSVGANFPPGEVYAIFSGQPGTSYLGSYNDVTSSIGTARTCDY